MDQKKFKSDKKIIVFEEISVFWLLSLFYNILKKNPIYYFRISWVLGKRAFIRKLVDNRTIIKFEVQDIGFFNLYALNSIALQDTEKIFHEDFEKNRTIPQLENLIGDKYIRNSYKKGLAFSLFELYRMNLYMKYLKNDKNTKKENLYFYTGRTFIELESIPFVKNYIQNTFWAVFPVSGRIFHWISYIIAKIKWILIYCAFPFWIFFQTGIPSLRKPLKARYNVGIRVGSYDWNPGSKYRSFDFLVDGKNINSENTLFCAEEWISEDYKRRILEKNYNLVNIRGILKNISIADIRTIFFGKFFKIYLKCLLQSFFENISTLIMTAKLFYTYMLWSAFEQKYEINHYVTYSEYLPEDILRNILLKKNDVKTWFFIHSISGPDTYEPPGSTNITLLEIFCNFDTVLVWGKRMELYFERYPHNIKNFKKIGCFWSEHVRVIIEENYDKDILNIAKKKFFDNGEFIPEKIIGVFDTTAGRDAPLTEDDLTDYINTIFSLLDDNPKFGIIFKNKFPLKELSVMNPGLVEVYKKIQNHPRCYLTDELNSDPSETIAASDLVISVSFTSPTIEALASKKKAIYYAPNNRFRGTYYDQIPHFVAHDDIEFKEMVEYWMNGISDVEFDSFLNQYIMGEIDQYIDGRAITRFRNKLVEK